VELPLSDRAGCGLLMAAALMRAEPAIWSEPEAVEPVALSGKISLRLRSDDLLLLRERAENRQSPTRPASLC
jgi:hypothetical protein